MYISCETMLSVFCCFLYLPLRTSQPVCEKLVFVTHRSKTWAATLATSHCLVESEKDLNIQLQLVCTQTLSQLSNPSWKALNETTKIPIAKHKASKTSKCISHLMKLFPASPSDKNFNLDRPPLFTVFTT